MKPFLKQVAQHYFSKGEISERCFIFPNRRSLVFFRKYLGEEAMRTGKPAIAPMLFPINDFFYTVTGFRRADKVQLLLTMYECYSKLYPKAEPLDDFIFWGDVLLGDFDDVDKYLVNAEDLFTNIADLKQIQDDYSYLTDKQRAALEDFIGHFRNGGKLTVKTDEEMHGSGRGVKAEFLKIWNILLPLYRDFNAALAAKGMAYEGQVYREFAERLDSESVTDILGGCLRDTRKFVFVGLNALNECEKKMMRKMRDAGIADFCWDYSSRMIKDPDCKSSFFMEANIREFPQSFTLDKEGLSGTNFTALSVPSLIGQAKQIPEILKTCPQMDYSSTAVVLPDENLLVPVLNSIPEGIRDINVTMGYPVGSSEFHLLLSEIGTMQMHIRKKDGKWHFYHRQVWSVFSNGVFKSVLSEEEEKIVRSIKEEARYYVCEDAFALSGFLKAIFRPIVTDSSERGNAVSVRLADYFQGVTADLATRLSNVEGMEVELEFAKECYKAIGQLRNNTLDLLPSTWIRLAAKVTGGISVPFKGEPLKGLQVMGPLETRALDFDHLIILSCNEGTFPRHSVSSSFIPHELRKGFDLPTYEYQDAVWAYYFYRMIQRAKNVWMVFDSRTEMNRSGEESRYIKQLEMHFGIPVRRMIAGSAISGGSEEQQIVKTEAHVAGLRETNLSATALQTYLSCKAKFFYTYVEGLKKPDEVSESMDAGMIGNVFHDTMKELYKPHRLITASWLRSLEKKDVKPVIRSKIMEKMHSFEVSGRNLIYEDMVLRYVMKVLERDAQLLEEEHSAGFEMIGVELMQRLDLHGFHLIGFIDRIDSMRDGEVRIVDYKTGKVKDSELRISDENADKVVEALFDGNTGKDKPKIALQLYIYDLFSKNMESCKGKRIVNSIYQVSRMFTEKPEAVALSDRFCSLMEERMERLFNEIADTAVPFDRTTDSSECKHCNFKMICGK